MKYIYTAVIIKDEESDKYIARIPDLSGCITTGKNIEDAIAQITDAVSIWLVDAEEDHPEDIIPPTPQKNITCPDGALLTLIQVDTLAYRAKIDTRAVRKNVSLPAWMAKLADKKGINCSQVLQEGLMKKLG